MPVSEAPSSTTAKGREGELRAARALEQAGYTVVERNARVGRYEIDIVAMDGEVLCFVEVRRRKRMDDALLSVTPRKQGEVARAASAYLARLGAAPRCRFDVVVVSGAHTRVLKNAFQAQP